jgi:hypothetical protein
MSEETMRQNLLVLAQTFATAKGLALTTVSKQIHGRDDFLALYLKGEMSPTVRTYHVMLNRLRARWPRGTRWPTTRSIKKLSKRVDKGFVDA